jgi:hypothetical protein
MSGPFYSAAALTRTFVELAEREGSPADAVHKLMRGWVENGHYQYFDASMKLAEAMLKRDTGHGLTAYSTLATMLRGVILEHYPVEGQAAVRPARTLDEIRPVHECYVQSALHQAQRLQQRGQLEQAQWLVSYAIHTTDGCVRPSPELVAREKDILIAAEARMHRAVLGRCKL